MENNLNRLARKKFTTSAPFTRSKYLTTISFLDNVGIYKIVNERHKTIGAFEYMKILF